MAAFSILSFGGGPIAADLFDSLAEFSEGHLAVAGHVHGRPKVFEGVRKLVGGQRVNVATEVFDQLEHLLTF
eukprot:CAMPEP_0204209808 /NCGR_PEP_ID=MMETSP0361-20130328/73477_1 /ASSEMBLY_ACC=CAM_ASM_000343 /TAXON_ID=268821 /ORGANISM="Scrippsiella Hangoei, Strain SHTV-5" /LENGTH=71 /DNA_ID=CAMNT_0051173821 /DNA_START=19 /DNA_END=231 /DNA_ORIENTATION=-